MRFENMHKSYAVLAGLVGDNLATTLGYFDAFLNSQASGSVMRLNEDDPAFSELMRRANEKVPGTTILGLWRLWTNEEQTKDRPIRHVGIILTSPDDGVEAKGHAVFTYTLFPSDTASDGGSAFQVAIHGFCEEDAAQFATSAEAIAYAAGLTQGIAPSIIMDAEAAARERYLMSKLENSLLGSLVGALRGSGAADDAKDRAKTAEALASAATLQ
jgi:hypothetical protein